MCPENERENPEKNGTAGNADVPADSQDAAPAGVDPEGTNGDEPAATDETAEGTVPGDPELARLKTDLEAKKKESQDLNNRLLRALADYDNVRKRSEREIWNAKQYGSEDLVRKMLPVIDSFESALKMMTEHKIDKKVLDGLEMLFMQFSDILEKEGLKPIKAKGEKFDPNRHEALMKRSDPDQADEVVVTELEKGYFFKEKVLRPAKVEINQH